ncbi:MAG: DUF4199 domain-containing protein [Salinivirgaceae bacterium]|jgi:hypothetical protein|nr:DUF4199 domain-containing protein [Salinivirgaceae bacterium]
MQENNLVKHTMTYGLYLGLAFSVVVIIIKIRGGVHHPGDTGGMINAMLLWAGMLVFGRRYRDSIVEGEFQYKNALGFTVLLTVFSALIYAFFSYWYYAKIELNGIPNYIEQMGIAYSQSGMFTEKDAEAILELYRKTLSPSMMAFIVFFSQALIGVLSGLIASIFIKSPIKSS